MRTLFVLILLISIAACSHPLEIVGRGDISSSTGENNCLVEEQPCANYVVGDYDVTYTAQPRAGWVFSQWEGCGKQFPQCTISMPASTVDLLWGQTAPPLRALFTLPPPTGDFLVTLNVDNAEAQPFGELFRSVNLDAGKQLNDAADIDRITQLMCTDPLTCKPGAIRYWDKVQFGRFALEQSITQHNRIAELHSRGFSLFWSLMGVPAFLRNSCSGCVVTSDNNNLPHPQRDQHRSVRRKKPYRSGYRLFLHRQR